MKLLPSILLSSVVLIASIQARSVDLEWDDNIIRFSSEPNTAPFRVYRIYYGFESETYLYYQEVINVHTTTVPDLLEQISYFFAVTVIDLNGNESNPSNEISIHNNSTH